MKNTKKWLLSLGTIAAATTPVVAAISCGTIFSDKDVKGSKVGWNDSTRTAYFNLFNQNESASLQNNSLEPFLKVDTNALSGSFPTLEIAQKWEQAAGYKVNQLGRVSNDQNAKQIKDGEMVHVVMGAQHFILKDPDSLHSTKWMSPEGYYIKFAFPFHTLENTILDDANEKNDLNLFNYYTAYKPWNVHTNFWKALNIVLAIKMGKTARADGNIVEITDQNGGKQQVDAALTNENNFKNTTTLDATSTKTDLILWNPAIGASADENHVEAVYQMYHDKEIVLTEADVTKVYGQSIS